MAARNSIDLDHDPLSIIGTRVLAAPRALVFSVWTDPKHLLQWWGPNGFRTTTRAFDFRPGGVWRFVMHGPDGRDYQNRITFDEIVAPERIVYRHDGAEDVESVCFTQTVTFEDGNARPVDLARQVSSAEEHARHPRIRCRQGQADDGGSTTIWQCWSRSAHRCSAADRGPALAAPHAGIRVPAESIVDLRVGLRPQRKRPGEQGATGGGNREATTTFIFRIDRNLDQLAAFKGLEGRSQRGAVHGKQCRDAADCRGFRPVQRHQQRKLAMRETNRTEHIVETSRQSARRTLDVKTQTIITHQMGRGQW